MYDADAIKRQFPDLIKQAVSGELTLFAGAGLSKMAGLPLWHELIRPLTEQLGITDDIDPITAAQYYVNEKTQGRRMLMEHLLEELDSRKAHFTYAHQVIKDLPFTRILTTNFDTLIEGTYSEEPERDHWIVIEDKDLSYKKRGTRIIKLNGCLSRLDSIIITREDFESYRQKKPLICDLLRTIMAETTILFVGTSFKDPVFAAFNAEIIGRLPEHRRPYYMVLLKSNKYEINDFKKRAIEIVDLQVTDHNTASDDVTKFLDALLTAVREASHDQQASPAGAPSSHGRPVKTLAPDYQRLLTRRLGTGLSLQLDPDHIDHIHRYTLLHRQDLLDYSTGDFYSIRRIAGRNMSDRLSSYLLYSESSEQKITFEQAAVRALDVNTRDELIVEPAIAPTVMAFTHAFKIYFAEPIPPGQSFDIVYTITLPGELKVLSPTNEIMSVSLVRIARGVEQLVFDVCLNFRPTLYSIECHNAEGRRVACKGNAPTVTEFVPETWIEKEFDIEWSAQPFKISWSCENPDSDLYIINYRSLDSVSARRDEEPPKS